MGCSKQLSVQVPKEEKPLTERILKKMKFSTTASDITLDYGNCSDSSCASSVISGICSQPQVNTVIKSEPSNLNSFIIKDVMKAGIIWSLQVVCRKITIASASSLGEDKASYVIVHGLAPYISAECAKWP
ncbi:hypothetical protein PR048_012866 [Dryococelus australis]|uniref:Uncharacterized protein n=1 Tax=Dryococelus australis TaxID=614101 RepID=A0ABQ9HQL1_9NEOP|nr:hypothetical protein PR048_012866 [Dryococelus australis]